MGNMNCCVKSKSYLHSEREPKPSQAVLTYNILREQPSNSNCSKVTLHNAENDFNAQLNMTSPEPIKCSISLDNGARITDSSSIMNLYNRYVDCERGYISAEGIERLCNDLEINPEDYRILVLAYSLGAEVMCRFTEDEFVGGCAKLNITDIPSMKNTLCKLVASLQDESFPSFYRWAYKFALDTENGQRTLSTDIAITLWKLVFSQKIPPLLGRWIKFLENNSSIKGISKDTWDMFLVFVDQIKGDLALYDDTEAWPSVLDEFVEHELLYYKSMENNAFNV